MHDNLVTALVSIVGAIIGLAALSVVLSPNAHTSQVIKAAAGALSQTIGAAVSPVTGGTSSMGGLSMGNGL